MADGDLLKLIETRVLTIDTNGATVDSLFPTLRRLVSYQFTQDYYLVAATLSSSIINVQTAPAGLFLGRDFGELVNIQQISDTESASDMFISQITFQNSTGVTIAPMSRTNTIAFGTSLSFVPVQAGTRLAVYGCSFNDASNLFCGVVNLHLVAKDIVG